jgi:uncharacterized damage-inducible protein DinB
MEPTMDLQYPVGRFDWSMKPGEAERRRAIDEIAGLPEAMRKAVRGLSEEQLDTAYRPGGWTVRQVAHHVPDSHLNAYVRFKLALTEDRPTIKPYDEARWAELPDTVHTPIGISLALLDALHERWVVLLQSIEPQDFARKFVHPEGGEMDLAKVLSHYAWHGRHHVAHITSLRQRMGW